MDIRNIAIIAHVDHGKTTLTDQMLRQTQTVDDSFSMDSNDLEKERGITIYAKNTSLKYTDTKGLIHKINIVDTPGHADFGSEVERVLRSIDSVVLVVDAQEGPMPQTRFVLKKSLELGHRPMVLINKVDKPAANPKEVHDQVFELFMELGANNEQLDFPTLYAIGKQGIASLELENLGDNLVPLFEKILEHVPPAKQEIEKPLVAQVFNLGYDNFLGRLAIARVYQGKIKFNQEVMVKYHGNTRTGKITKIFTFNGTNRIDSTEAEAGDIIILAGIPDISIGETIVDNKETQEMPAIAVDEPTIKLSFLVNNSPFAGREGKFVTTRQIRERLERELEVNVGLRVDFSSSSTESYEVFGRGEMHIAILLEQMRREGFELQVSEPEVILKEENGQKLEPFEEVTIDIPESSQGIVIEKLGMRGVVMTGMHQGHNNRIRLQFEGPTRGLFGYRGEFIVDTRGEGIFASRVLGFKPHIGPITKRHVGSMISMTTGKALGFALFNLQDRGQLYIEPATEVYEGMVIGNTSKGEEMSVNPTKGKQLTNMRASGSDESISLVPPLKLTIERGLEVMQHDEYLEITPKSVRLRKQDLTESERSKNKRQK